MYDLMADYRLHQITWKNVIDYNDYDYKLRLPGLMCQSEEVGLMCQEWRSWAKNIKFIDI
jgi:hypothetical protein